MYRSCRGPALAQARSGVGRARPPTSQGGQVRLGGHPHLKREKLVLGIMQKGGGRLRVHGDGQVCAVDAGCGLGGLLVCIHARHCGRRRVVTRRDGVRVVPDPVLAVWYPTDGRAGRSHVRVLLLKLGRNGSTVCLRRRAESSAFVRLFLAVSPLRADTTRLRRV